MKKILSENLQLTEERKALLQEQELSADPTDRLFSDYYTVTRQLILQDYYNSKANDLEEFYDERETLNNVLEKLRKDYVHDLENWIEICQAIHGMAAPPVRFKLMVVD